MGLGRLLKGLVVGARLQPVLFPLGVDPVEYIADERGVLS
jgi:hypothetical protein